MAYRMRMGAILQGDELDGFEERFHNGHRYIVERRVPNGTRYMVCARRSNRDFNCRGRIILYANGDVRTRRGHNHQPILDEELSYIFRSRLFRAVINRFENPRVIYDELALLYPEGARLNPYNEPLQATIRRWRRTFRPPTPRTFDDLIVFLTADDWQNVLVMGQTQMNAVVAGEPGNRCIALYDPAFVRQFETTELMLFDATFGTVPRLEMVIPHVNGVAQLFIAMGLKYDCVLPLFYVFMESRRRVNYDGVMRIIRHAMPRLRVAMTMSDFEGPLQEAIAAAFPRAHRAGCLFHQVKAVLKNEELRIPQNIRLSDEGAMFLKRVKVLALLPPEMIEETFERLVRNLSPQMAAGMDDFILYYRRQWLQRVGVNNLSVYNLTRRTNNNVEALNRMLRDRMGRHPGLWVFLQNLLNIQNRMRNDLRSLEANGRARFAPMLHYMMRNDVLLNTWRLLGENRIDVDEAIEIFVQNNEDAYRAIQRYYLEVEDEQEAEDVPAAAVGGVGQVREALLAAQGAARIDQQHQHENVPVAQLGGAGQVPQAPLAAQGAAWRHQQNQQNNVPAPQVVGGAGQVRFAPLAAEGAAWDYQQHQHENVPAAQVGGAGQMRQAPWPVQGAAPHDQQNHHENGRAAQVGVGGQVRRAPFDEEEVPRDGLARDAFVVNDFQLARLYNPQFPVFPVSNDEYDRICIICHEHYSCIIFTPCYHQIACAGCSNLLVDVADATHRIVTCPYCQGLVVNMFRPQLMLAVNGAGENVEDARRGNGTNRVIPLFVHRNERYYHMCSICDRRESNIVFEPCGHEVLCAACANQMCNDAEALRREAFCPSCGDVVERAHRVMMPLM